MFILYVLDAFASKLLSLNKLQISLVCLRLIAILSVISFLAHRHHRFKGSTLSLSSSKYFTICSRIGDKSTEIASQTKSQLRGSLINQDFITIGTFTGKRHQTTISYQVNVTS